VPRRPRLIIPNVPIHITQRGIDRCVTFISDDDFALYLWALGDASVRAGCAVHAYALMTNHVHFLVTPASSDAAAYLMRALGQRYVRYFNDRYRGVRGRCGKGASDPRSSTRVATSWRAAGTSSVIPFGPGSSTILERITGPAIGGMRLVRMTGSSRLTCFTPRLVETTTRGVPPTLDSLRAKPRRSSCRESARRHAGGILSG
jgi:REP element-mobilizing transposase RayT